MWFLIQSDQKFFRCDFPKIEGPIRALNLGGSESGDQTSRFGFHRIIVFVDTNHCVKPGIVENIFLKLVRIT